MSDPPSPTSTSLLSPFDVRDDHPQQRSAVSDPARQARLAALERRLRGESIQSSSSDAATLQDPQPFDANHAKRTEFRRLVDPGIMRPNSKEVASRSLRVNSKHSLFLAVRELTEGMVLFLPYIIFDVMSCANHSPFFPRGSSCHRPCPRSRRIYFANLTTPSSVSSNRRIRSSSGIL